MGKHNKNRERKGPDERAYDVGYEKPPKAHQFKPGQSGNPKGRPKKPPSLRGAAERAAAQVIMARGPDGLEPITKLEAAVESTFNNAIKGIVGAMKLAVSICVNEGVGVSDDDEEQLAMDAHHFEMLMGELARMKGDGS